jgi:UDP-2-acetamido-3-amino-2,3-dideoxy-glucuronate N-acetyltransferase
MKVFNFIDPTAEVHPTVKVWHYAVILGGVILEADVSVGSHSEIGKNSIVRRGARIGKGVFLPTNSHIGSEVFIGPGTIFCDDKYPIAGNVKYKALPPLVRSRASIGAGCVILPGVTIGIGAVVGAGSVVVEDVPDGGTVYGDAARLRNFPSQDELETAECVP